MKVQFFSMVVNRETKAQSSRLEKVELPDDTSMAVIAQMARERAIVFE